MKKILVSRHLVMLGLVCGARRLMNALRWLVRWTGPMVLGFSVGQFDPVCAQTLSEPGEQLMQQSGQQVAADSAAINGYLKRQLKQQSPLFGLIEEDLIALPIADLLAQLAPPSATVKRNGSAVTPEEITRVIAGIAERTPEQKAAYISAALRLFPLQSVAWGKTLVTQGTISQADWHALREQHNLPPVPPPIQAYAPLPGGDKADTSAAIAFVPLIETISIRLQHKGPPFPAQSIWRYRYRLANETNSHPWQLGLPLLWDPVGQVYGSVMIELAPASEYEVQFSDDGDFGAEHTLRYRVATGGDRPPIDPDKVFLLKDIYRGGTLDLEQLGIEGKPGAYAAIIGSADTVIHGDKERNAAVHIGNNSYIYFDNLHIAGGRMNAVESDAAHHLWFRGCDISGWGRPRLKDKPANEDGETKSTRLRHHNYDSAFYLRRTGVVVVEHCRVHSPAHGASNWQKGHPKGPNAFLVDAGHPQLEFQGQVVLRRNHFAASDRVRFNDVIESRRNGDAEGGFVRDSAVYENYLAFANDDILELDGAMSNVAVYGNRLTRGFNGVSAIPNRRGPVFVVGNTIDPVGDETGRSWSVVKLGGAYAAPIGLAYFAGNEIVVADVGFAAARYRGDRYFWAILSGNQVRPAAKPWRDRIREFEFKDAEPAVLIK